MRNECVLLFDFIAHAIIFDRIVILWIFIYLCFHWLIEVDIDVCLLSQVWLHRQHLCETLLKRGDTEV